ncbi:hypothetical protein [Streptomyces sp. NPDC007905]|uniref:hypothetical protein n=1 Tax=Streptomyces sp. NPDC007905 TaxID=3364788 RepID=UPI0036EB5134
MLLSQRRPNGHFRLAAPVADACLGVSMLHALWDATHGIAIRLVARLSGTGPEPELLPAGVQPTTRRRRGTSVHVAPGRRRILVTLPGIAWGAVTGTPGPSWENTP